MKTLTLKINGDLYKWLDRKSKQLGQSKSAITRGALEKVRSSKDQPSCHDLMIDVCGSVRGPKDLATNKRYLKGFGAWKR